MSSNIDRIYLVGHCGPDAGMLEAFVERAADVEVGQINSQKQLEESADSRTLLLVNRVLDGRFETESGVELIGQLAKASDPPQMMLISNYDDAQQQAREAGAMPGFGKDAIGTSQARQRLDEVLGQSPTTSSR